MEEVRNWLRGLGLGQYAHKFEEDGWDSLEMLQHMRPNEVEACIDKPGHRRKFEFGIQTDFPKEKGSGDAGDDGSILVEENTKKLSTDIVTKTDHTLDSDKTRIDETETAVNTTDCSETDVTKAPINMHDTPESEKTVETKATSIKPQDSSKRLKTYETGANLNTSDNFGESETQTNVPDSSERELSDERQTHLSTANSSERSETDETKTKHIHTPGCLESAQTYVRETPFSTWDISERTQTGETKTALNTPNSLSKMHNEKVGINTLNQLGSEQTDKCEGLAVRDSKNDALTNFDNVINNDEPISKEGETSQLPLNSQHDVLDNAGTTYDFTSLKNTNSDAETYLSTTSNRVDSSEDESPVYTETLCVKGVRNKMILPAVRKDVSSLVRGVGTKHNRNKVQPLSKGAMTAKAQRTRLV